MKCKYLISSVRRNCLFFQSTGAYPGFISQEKLPILLEYWSESRFYKSGETAYSFRVLERIPVLSVRINCLFFQSTGAYPGFVSQDKLPILLEYWSLSRFYQSGETAYSFRVLELIPVLSVRINCLFFQSTGAYPGFYQSGGNCLFFQSTGAYPGFISQEKLPILLEYWSLSRFCQSG